MQLGMIGLGRMGANMVRRLLARGHDCVVYDHHADNVAALVAEGATGADSAEDLVRKLKAPRAVWLMVPVPAVEGAIQSLVARLERGDILIDGGNSPFELAQRRAAELDGRGIDFVDVGTSGGVWGRERGYCLMVGGAPAAVKRLAPLLKDLAPGRGAIPPAPGFPEDSTATEGWLHCGGPGAGHFVKMVHNGIEYGLMAAYAEGFNLMKHAGAGREGRAENPGRYPYDLDLPAIAELWRRGSVISSWLLDLTAAALAADPKLAGFAGQVSDSGEGRWAVKAALDTAVPVPVLSAALHSRFESRGEAAFANQLLSALRLQFGGHREPGATAGRKEP